MPMTTLRKGNPGAAVPLLSASGEQQLLRRREGVPQDQRGASGTIYGLQRPCFGAEGGGCA